METAAKQGIFRAGAIERLSSPERLDTLVRIVGRKSWLALGAIASLVAFASVWSIAGRVALTAAGRGVLLRPRTVRAVQAPSAGLLAAFSIRDGDLVTKGQEIGSIDQYELRQKLSQEREKLSQLQKHHEAAQALETKRDAVELEAISEKRARLEARVKEREELARKEKTLDEEAIAHDRISFAERLAAAQKIVEAAKHRVEIYKRLLASGLARDEGALDAERVQIDAANRVLDVQREIEQLSLRDAELVRKHQEKLDQIAALRDELGELGLRASKIKMQALEARAQFERESQSVQDTIASLELALARQGKVLAEYDGRVLELSASVGQQVSQGMRLALIEEGDPTRGLVCVAYVAVRDGKRISVGSRAQVEPDTVQRERYGGIRAKVTDVSPYPITFEAASSLIGNGDVAKDAFGEGTKIQVTLELTNDSDTKSGYAWSSSRGPDLKITGGTTASVRLKLEERAPVTFVVPYLRELLGL